jgi:hypothetical protein
VPNRAAQKTVDRYKRIFDFQNAVIRQANSVRGGAKVLRNAILTNEMLCGRESGKKNVSSRVARGR